MIQYVVRKQKVRITKQLLTEWVHENHTWFNIIKYYSSYDHTQNASFPFWRAVKGTQMLWLACSY